MSYTLTSFAKLSFQEKQSISYWLPESPAPLCVNAVHQGGSCTGFVWSSGVKTPAGIFTSFNSFLFQLERSSVEENALLSFLTYTSFALLPTILQSQSAKSVLSLRVSMGGNPPLLSPIRAHSVTPSDWFPGPGSRVFSSPRPKKEERG